MSMPMPFVIAVDGPAASGKGTLSRRLANYYGLAYLDTGMLYRGVGWCLLNSSVDPRDEAAASATARAFALDQIDGANIRTADVGKAASVVAAQPAVRAALLDFQRDFAVSPPGHVRGAVLDGRDIGTVVCPDALVKLYVTATPEVRAERRWKDLRSQDPSATLEGTLEDIQRRDARDSGREAAPMRPATDAEFMDTTSLNPDAAFARACRFVDQALDASDVRPSVAP